MKVLKRGIMPDGTNLQIEDWSDNYTFMSHGSTLAAYPKSKISLDGSFAPKGKQEFRCAFNFNSEAETRKAFSELIIGVKELADFKANMHDPKYADCI